MYIVMFLGCVASVVLFCHTLDAVSYTHLDVYKRQVPKC